MQALINLIKHSVKFSCTRLGLETS